MHRVAEHPAAGVLARAGGAYTAMVAGDLDAAENDARVALSEARTVDERFLVVLTLSVITLYRGTHDASRRWCGDLLDIDGLTLARRSCGHSGMALAACYDGDLVEARRHAAAGLAAAEAAGADAYRAFASYTAAEIAAADDLTAAVPLLAEAARDADGVRARFPAGLATTALVAALTRLGRGREALDLVGPLLDRWLRLATWPQLWTTLRILAELLDEHERPETAALLLAAADTAPSAPAVTGEDVDRYGRLSASVRGRVGSRALEKIDALAAVLSRAQVVERARAAVDELRAP